MINTSSLLNLASIAIFKRKFKKNGALLLFITFFSCINAQSQVTVAGAVTGNGSYMTLAAAFTAIPVAQVGANINVTITGNTTEPVGGATLVAGTWTSLTIAPSGGSWTVSGAATAGTPLITFNGSDKVTVNGGGNLTFANTTASSTTGTSTLKLVGDATYNTFNNLTILGSATGATGTNTGNVWISTGIVSGNDFNSFQSCKFGPAGTNLPGKLLFALGTTTSTTTENSNININNCEFSDYFQATTASAALYMSTGNTAWTVTNNKIFQTAARTITTVQTDYGIFMVNAGTTALGENFVIKGNTIGYASNSGTGTMTYASAATAGGFVGINFSASAASTSTNSINNNIISDIQWTSTGASIFTGIASSGLANITTGAVYNVTGNTVRNIASVTATGTMIGIYAGYAPTTSISNNTVNNITRTGSGIMYGIQYNGGATTTTTLNANTVSNLANNNASSASALYAIYSGSSIANEIWTNNTIEGLSSISIGAMPMYGIYGSTANTGNKTCQNNIVRNFSLSASSTGSMFGIRIGYLGANNIFSGNTIYNFSGGTSLYGLYVGGSSAATVSVENVFNNKVNGLSSYVVSPSVYGLYIAGGITNNVYNNIIGSLTTPAANTAISVYGIYLSAGTTDNVYYNTVNLSGTSTGVNFGSAAVYASATPTSIDMRNNVLVNTASANGTGKAVAFQRTAAALTNYASTCNNNLYYGTSGAYYDTTTVTAPVAFQALVTPREAASKFQNPAFASTTGADVTFLHFADGAINLAGGFATPITGYTIDFDGNTRDAATPDIGADEWNNGVIIAPTITGFSTTYSPFAPIYLCSNGGSVVTITGTSLDTTTSVLFNGASGVNLPGTITEQSDTSLTVTAPADVVDGVIRVINPAGSIDSATIDSGSGQLFGLTYVQALPPAIVVSPAATICSGTNTTLVATGANTYTWSPIATLSAATGDTVTATPTAIATTTYTVTGITTAGCKATNTVAVTVNPTPSAITIAKNPALVCLGGVSTLTATGGLVGGTMQGVIGTGTATSTSTGSYSAFNGYRASAWSQTIFTAAELTAAGLSAGNIRSIAYNINSQGSSTSNNITIKIGATATSAFANTTFYTTTAYTTVFGPTAYIHSASGWQTINFSTPYSWDGTSNIVVDVWQDGPDASADPLTYYTAASNNKANYTYNVSPSTGATGTLTVNRFNITFAGTNSVPTTLAWTPSTDLYSNAGDITAYAGQNLATVYFKSLIPQTYTVAATLGACSSTANVTVTPIALPTAIITASSDTIFCVGGSVVLTANQGNTYLWSTGETTESIIVNAIGNYSVQLTNSNGCQSKPSEAILVMVNNLSTPTFTPFASTCSGATMSPLPTTSDNGITGTWSPALNNTETTTYTFTPDAGQCATTTTQTINITTPKVTSPISFVAATLGALNCGSTSVAGTLTYGIAASSVSSSVPYTVGNGGSYQAQTIASTGVTGLTATLAAGTFATGAGNLTYTITGTPASSGTASFALNIGGQTCTLTLTVNSTVGTITDINCASAINSGTLTQGTAANGVSSVLSYTGGTGGAYSGQTVSSTGVTGLTATLNSGTFANGAGSLTYTITGTPASIEIASFPLNIGGQTCTLELTVQSSAIVFNPNLTYGNITDIDGNNYKTIQIGDKRWMAENLKVTKYSNGDIIPNITDGSTWYNSSSGAWAYYNNNSAYNTVYGKIYNGYAASDARNVCPSNWRVPNEQDWSSLEEFIGIPLNEISNTGYRGTDQAKKVKETGNRHWADLQGMFGDTIQNNATNEVGLTLIPTGYRGTPFGQFESINYSGYYWGNPWQSARFFLSYGNQIYKNVNDTEPFGMAIRCVKDETPPQGSISTLDCPGTTYNGTLNIGTSASGVSSLVHYTGGNGGTHSEQTVTSNGVTGLTATLAAGTFATGAGNLTYTITGTPASSGTASFALNIGGQTCTLTLTVTALPNVTIGTQIWTNKNLDISTYRDGTPIPQITNPDEWSSLTTGAWCYYNNDPANGEVYGKLYNWYAVAGIYDAASLNDPSLRKQLAPIGWHVPSDAEWTVVTDFLGGESIAGGKMKETGTNHWTSPNTGTTNTSGFTGLPGGYYFNYSSQFTNILDFGYWWSSSELGTDFAWYRNLYYNFGNAYRSNGNKTFGLSVRLIKD